MSYSLIKCVIVDTCVLLDDPQVLVRMNKMGKSVFLSNTILRELDSNKKGDQEINKNARKIFREFVKESVAMSLLPDGTALKSGDGVVRFLFGGFPVFVISRDIFKQGNNDSQIMDVAMDYKFHIVTRDNAFYVLAKTAGLPVTLWQGLESEKDIKGFPFGFTESSQVNQENFDAKGTTFDFRGHAAAKEKEAKQVWTTEPQNPPSITASQAWDLAKTAAPVVGSILIIGLEIWSAITK